MNPLKSDAELLMLSLRAAALVFRSTTKSTLMVLGTGTSVVGTSTARSLKVSTAKLPDIVAVPTVSRYSRLSPPFLRVNGSPVTSVGMIESGSETSRSSASRPFLFMSRSTRVTGMSVPEFHSPSPASMSMVAVAAWNVIVSSSS